MGLKDFVVVILLLLKGKILFLIKRIVHFFFVNSIYKKNYPLIIWSLIFYIWNYTI